MKLIKKLQECATMGQADPILTKLNAGPAVKKLVETALVLSNSQDPQQRNHAYSFMESAIKELEDDEKLKEEEMGMHGNEDGLNNHKIGEQEDDDEEDKERETHEENEKDKEHKIHEEELSNNNQGGRTSGSEQSTDNTEPYPGEGKDTTTGEKPMQDMDGAVNQWNETGGMPPGVPPGVPPGMQPGMNGLGEMPNGGGMIVPGLAPDIAQEMGLGMPQPPPMDTNQMMRQIQYTVQNVIKDYDKRVVTPMMQHIKNQRETLLKQKDVMKKLAREIQETKTNSGSLKLDLDSIKKNSSAHFRETVPTIQNFTSTENNNARNIVQPIPNQQRFKVEAARSEIEQMDKILNSNKNPIYN